MDEKLNSEFWWESLKERHVEALDIERDDNIKMGLKQSGRA
jgi:hypothetical protein